MATIVTIVRISLGFHQNIGLHTDARANVVLLTYLLTLKYYSNVDKMTEMYTE